MTYIVNIEGSDPFIAEDEGAIYRGLDDLEGGKDENGDDEGIVVDSYETAHGFRMIYINNIGEELNIVATETEYYK